MPHPRVKKWLLHLCKPSTNPHNTELEAYNLEISKESEIVELQGKKHKMKNEVMYNII